MLFLFYSFYYADLHGIEVIGEFRQLLIKLISWMKLLFSKPQEIQGVLREHRVLLHLPGPTQIPGMKQLGNESTQHGCL